MTANLCGLVCH